MVEFCCGSLCVYVRELSHGLLPGFSNLYCLDGDLRLMWLAEWPEAYGPCTRIVEASNDVVVAESASGTNVIFNAHSGAMVGIDHALAAAG